MTGKISTVVAGALYLLAGGLPAAWGEDLSAISVDATTHSEEIGVHFLIMDPLGRRMGNDCTRRKDDPLLEIPGPGYIVESTGDDESGRPGPEGIQSTIRPVAAGTYTITLCGLATKWVHLYVSGRDVSAKRQPNPRSLDGFIAAGTTAQYVLSYDPAPGKGITQFVKQVSFATLRQDLRTAAGLGFIGDAKFVAKLDKILAEGEKALSKKGGKDRENRKEAAGKLREFIQKLEKAFMGEKDNDRDEDDKDDDKDHKEKEHEKPAKRFVSELAFKALKGDAETLIGTLGGKSGKDDGRDGGKEHDR